MKLSVSSRNGKRLLCSASDGEPDEKTREIPRHKSHYTHNTLSF